MSDAIEPQKRLNMRRLRAGVDLGANHLAVGPGPAPSAVALTRALESAVASALFLDEVVMVFQLSLRPLPLSQWSPLDLPEPAALVEAIAERCAETDERLNFFVYADRVVGFASGLSGRDEGDRLATQLLVTFRRAFNILGTLVHFDVRIGTASPTDRVDEAEALQTAAGLALRSTTPSSPFGSYGTRLQAENDRDDRLRADLATIVASGELELVYQPILDLATRRISGFEAFVRWAHPEVGTLTPPEFLRLVESSEQIYDIGDHVLTTAAQTVSEWVRTGLVGDTTLWLNVTAIELLRVGFKQRVREVMDATPGVSLGLDLVEGRAAAEETVCEVIRSLALDDVRASVDGFGGNHSLLHDLDRLPYDTVKMNQKIVSTIDSDHGSRGAITLLAQLAHSAGLHVVATGVETTTQLELLRAMGVDAIQGYLSSHPLTADEMRARLASASWSHNSPSVD